MDERLWRREPVTPRADLAEPAADRQRPGAATRDLARERRRRVAELKKARLSSGAAVKAASK